MRSIHFGLLAALTLLPAFAQDSHGICESHGVTSLLPPIFRVCHKAGGNKFTRQVRNNGKLWLGELDLCSGTLE